MPDPGASGTWSAAGSSVPASPGGTARIDRHIALRTPGRYGLVRRLASDAGDALGGHRLVQRAALSLDRRDHRRPRRPAAARVAGGRAACPAAGPRSHRPSRWSRSNTSSATGRPGRPARRSRSASSSARPRASTTTSSPSSTADRAATRTASPASSGRRGASSRPAPSTSRTTPSPARSAGSTYARTRWPPHVGSNRKSGESNGSGCGVGHIGATSPGTRERRLEPEGELLGHRRPMVAPRPGIDWVAPARRPARSRDCRPAPIRRIPCPDPHAPTTSTVSQVPFDPRLVARRPDRRLHREDERGRHGRLPPLDLGGAGRRVGGAAARLTLGARTDRHARFSPDGRTLAFLSDRRLLRRGGAGSADGAEGPRLDAVQVYLLPLDGGEARRLTDLPRGVTELAWSPDGRTLAVLTSSLGATADEDRRRRGRGRQAEARRDAAVRLPLSRPARLPVQRPRVHRRPGRAPVAGGRRDRRGPPAGGGPTPEA